MKNIDKDIRKIEDLEDGSTVYEIGPPPEEESKPSTFYDNLADKFSEEGLKKLSAYLLEAIDEDIESRREWLDAVEKAKKYLGYALEDLNDIPFPFAARTYDATLSTALLRFYSSARAKFLLPRGPSGYEIMGSSNDKVEEIGERVRDFLNYFLTTADKPYYSDFERFLLYLGLYGSAFKKVYYDKLQKKPLSRFILPEDFIINSDCTSILESERLTHVLHLSKREIMLNQQREIYRDIELIYLKSLENNDDEEDTRTSNNDVDLEAYTKRTLFPIYESHTYINLADYEKKNSDSLTDESISLPYIVTIDKLTKNILSIQRGWLEKDQDQKRRNFFVQYNYLPGFGIHGLGLAQIGGSNAIALTRIQRQLIDAAAYKNLPGGLRTKGFKQQNNDLIVGPGQFVEVDTGGIPLQEAFMPLPYSDPSNIYRELMLGIIQQTKEVCSTNEMGMLDSKEDIPTMTAMAFLETNNVIQDAVLGSIYYSLSEELQLITQVFSETLDTQEFYFSGKQQTISADDFIKELRIIPIADPKVNSTLQKTLKAESILRFAQQDPAAHNMHNIFHMLYKAQGLDEQEIENILKPDQTSEEIMPLDPITENMNAMRGIPLKAAIWQEHDAHIISHAPFAQENPDIQAHIQEHRSYKYLVDMQMQLGFELPPLERLQDPEIQNAIALRVAEVANNQMSQQESQAPMDPNALLMADIQQKTAETEARERIANQKAETDIFKAQLDFEKEKMKIESNEDIAELKSDTELQKLEQRNVY